MTTKLRGLWWDRGHSTLLPDPLGGLTGLVAYAVLRQPVITMAKG